MTDINAELIAEAHAHIAQLAEGFPPDSVLREKILAGDVEDPRVSLIVRLTAALEADEAKTTVLVAEGREKLAEGLFVLTAHGLVDEARAAWEALPSLREQYLLRADALIESKVVRLPSEAERAVWVEGFHEGEGTGPEHPAHTGHEFGGAYARGSALIAGDPNWMNATGGQPE